jgi:general stress protein 26
MNTPNPFESSSGMSRKHANYVVDLTKKMADGTRPGVLATVDENGAPHLRWMATLSLHDFPLLYTITSPISRKIQHIVEHPQVSWMFSNEEMNVIVNLRGNARIVTDSAKIQQVWKMLEDKSRAYFLSISTEGAGFAVIETEIEDIDCIVPKYEIRFQAHAADFKSCSTVPGE